MRDSGWSPRALGAVPRIPEAVGMALLFLRRCCMWWELGCGAAPQADETEKSEREQKEQHQLRCLRRYLDDHGGAAPPFGQGWGRRCGEERVRGVNPSTPLRRVHGEGGRGHNLPFTEKCKVDEFMAEYEQQVPKEDMPKRGDFVRCITPPTCASTPYAPRGGVLGAVTCHVFPILPSFFTGFASTEGGAGVPDAHSISPPQVFGPLPRLHAPCWLP